MSVIAQTTYLFGAEFASRNVCAVTCFNKGDRMNLDCVMVVCCAVALVAVVNIIFALAIASGFRSGCQRGVA